MFISEIVALLRLECIGFENVLASYLMYEGMRLALRVGNDSLELGWITHGKCILHSLILDKSELDDTGIGDISQLDFKPIGLIVTSPDVDIYNYGLICEDLPKSCYVVNTTYEAGFIDLLVCLKLPSNIPKTLDIRRHGFRVMPSKVAT